MTAKEKHLATVRRLEEPPLCHCGDRLVINPDNTLEFVCPNKHEVSAKCMCWNIELYVSCTNVMLFRCIQWRSVISRSCWWFSFPLLSRQVWGSTTLVILHLPSLCSFMHLTSTDNHFCISSGTSTPGLNEWRCTVYGGTQHSPEGRVLSLTLCWISSPS